jgi:hypothetical protein
MGTPVFTVQYVTVVRAKAHVRACTYVRVGGCLCGCVSMFVQAQRPY